TACGAVGGGNTSGGTVCIATDFPVSGTDGSEGIPAQNGVELAVSNAKLHGNYTLQLNKFDDAVNGVHNATQGATNLTKMVGDSCVVAAVGPFNSNVAGAEIPIATANGLALISPSNTNPGLTLQQYSQTYGFQFDKLHPAGKPEAYFRVCANDVAQGKEVAKLATEAGFKKAYLVDDSEPYGKGLADFFEQSFTGSGGTVIDTGSSRDEISAQNTTNLGSLADKIKQAAPDVVFFGGVTSGGGAALRSALTSKSVTVPMYGGDGIAQDPSFIQIAGATAAEGSVGTVAAPDLAGLTGGGAQTFLADYKAKDNTDPIAYSVNAYDIGNLEIAAINRVIDAGKPVNRANVLAEIAKTDYNGITGHITFDQNGDNSGQKVFSVYKVQGGKWVFVKEEPLQ
ncbi:MAG: branched-chain amino acid ABC transporter substrate-binding protein, partial [Ktedonobacterales bacterium]